MASPSSSTSTPSSSTQSNLNPKSHSPLLNLPPELHLRIANLVFSFQGPHYNAIFAALRAIPPWRQLATQYGFRVTWDQDGDLDDGVEEARVVFREEVGCFLRVRKGEKSGREFVVWNGVPEAFWGDDGIGDEGCGWDMREEWTWTGKGRRRCSCDKVTKKHHGGVEACYWCV